MESGGDAARKGAEPCTCELASLVLERLEERAHDIVAHLRGGRWHWRTTDPIKESAAATDDPIKEGVGCSGNIASRSDEQHLETVIGRPLADDGAQHVEHLIVNLAHGRWPG